MVAGGGRTDVLSYIYIPPKSPFDKGGLVARLCLALLRNLDDTIKVAKKSVRNFDMVAVRGLMSSVVFHLLNIYSIASW